MVTFDTEKRTYTIEVSGDPDHYAAVLTDIVLAVQAANQQEQEIRQDYFWLLDLLLNMLPEQHQLNI